MNNQEERKSNLIKVNQNILEFKNIIKDIAENPNVLALKEHHQHIASSRYSHCLEVSYYTYLICKKLGLDYVSAARGALLHDFYFYDWRNKNVEGQKKFHLLRHPKIALTNAIDLFELNELEQDIIIKHMWPLTVKFPKFTESFIVTWVDKYCATAEFFHSFKVKRINKINEIAINESEN